MRTGRPLHPKLLEEAYQFADIYGHNTSSLYRDDDLCCFSNISDPESDRIRKTNLRIGDFLDVTFNLTTVVYKPYSKPNSQTIYINVNSNHSPNIIKRIPDMISDKITKSSSNKKVFDQAAPQYNNALAASGYMRYIQNNPAQPRNPKSQDHAKLFDSIHHTA